MKRKSCAWLFLAVMQITGLAWGQNVSTTASSQPAPTADAQRALEPSLTVSTGTAQQFQTNINDDGGKFSLTRYGVGAALKVPVNQRLSLTNTLHYEYDSYHFSGTGSKLWDDSNLLTYGLQVAYGINRQWSVFGGPTVGFSAESDANWSDAFTYGGVAGVNWQPNADFSLGMGLLVSKPVEEDPFVFPLVMVDWKITKDLRLHNARSAPGIRGGAGIELVWTFVPKWDLSIGGAYERRTFRLDSQSAVANGVARNSCLPVYVSLRWNPAPQWTLGVLGGVAFGGELRLENQSGDEIRTTNYEPAPFVGAMVSWRP